MRASLLNSVIERLGKRLALIAIALVLAGISAGAKYLWTSMAGKPSRPASTAVASRVTVKSPSRSAVAAPMPASTSPADSANAKPGTVYMGPPAPGTPASPAAAPNAKPGAPASAPAAPTGKPAAPGTVPALRPSALPQPSMAGAPATAGKSAPPQAAPQAPAPNPGGLKAQAASAMTPMVSVAPKPAAKPIAGKPGASPTSHLDEQLTYQYEAIGRRDPFQSLVNGGFVGMDLGGDAPLDVGGLRVVGIVWGDDDKFAMVEDARGQSNVLRVGDKVQNGVITGLKRDAVIVNLTVDGQSQTVTIPLTKKGDQSNANR